MKLNSKHLEERIQTMLRAQMASILINGVHVKDMTTHFLVW